ncbi:MRG-domain-containing protein [Xylariales sp. PMI_506]|nr:MRG-domain-containing protein [Xylariales sp. PMI_506]
MSFQHTFPNVLSQRRTRQQAKLEDSALRAAIERSRRDSCSAITEHHSNWNEDDNGTPKLHHNTSNPVVSRRIGDSFDGVQRVPVHSSPNHAAEAAFAVRFAEKEARYFEEAQRNDHLLKLPPNKQNIYVNPTRNQLLLGPTDTPYNLSMVEKPTHPKIAEAMNDDTWNQQKEAWYRRVPEGVNIPIAGTPSDNMYRPRISERDPPESNGSTITCAHNTLSSVLWSALTRTPTLTFGPIGAFVLRGANLSDVQEDAFHQRPSVKIHVPDLLKGLLVDDWENITKNNQLVPLPHPKPVSLVLTEYIQDEKSQRPEGSSSLDILEETVAGLREYFDKCLGRILLYRFERPQYAEVREKWADPKSELHGKTPSETYGVEHLMRLFTSLPELIAQTNMDQQSVNRLREELHKFCTWLERHAGDYFLPEYETPNNEYSDKAKN